MSNNHNKKVSNNINSDTPLLDSIPKRNPFIAPEGYFDDFQKELHSKIKKLPTTNKPVNNYFENFIFRLLKPQFAVAASILAIFAIASVVTYNYLENKTQYFSQSENFIPIEVKFNQITDTFSASKITANYLFKDDKKTIIINYTNDININQLKSYYSNNFAVLPDNIEKEFEDKILKLELKENFAIHSKNIKNINEKPIIDTEKPIDTNLPIQNIIYSSTNNSTNHSPIQINNSSTINTNNSFYTSNLTSIIDKDSFSRSNKLPPFYVLPEQICKEKSFILTPDVISEKYIYEWSTGENTTQINIKESGIYTLKLICIENPKNYSISKTEVKILPKPIKTLPSTAILCSNNSLILKPEIENPELYTYFWLPTNQTEPNITIRNPGMYVLATTACHTYFDTVVVFKQHCDVNFPNIITPNNDGINDYFYISGLENHPNTSLTIFDRSRKIVYSTNDYNNKWDGDMLPEGTYFYIAIFKDGIEKHGSLTILR